MNKIDYKILVDTREKRIDNIIKAFEKNNVKYERRALPIGDYIIESSTGYVPNITIERKASIDELIANLLDKSTADENGNNRFTRELIRSKQANKKFILLIEDEKFYINMLTGNYRSRINPKAAKGLIPENNPVDKVIRGQIGITNMASKSVGLIGVRFEDNVEFGPTVENFESTNIIGDITSDYDHLEKLKEGVVVYVAESNNEAWVR